MSKYSKYPSKRRREDEDDLFGGDYKRSASQRVSPHTQNILRLRREIVEIGEPSKLQLPETLKSLGDGLSNIDSETRNGLLKTIIAVVTEQPHKIPLLAGAIQIANTQDDVFGQVIIELSQGEIQNGLDNGDLNRVKLFVRFIVCLSPIIQGDSVYELLKGLLDRAIELQNIASSDANEKYVKKSLIGEQIYVSVLLALPYFVISAIDGLGNLSFANDILNQSKDFKIADSKVVSLIQPFVDSKGGSVPYEPKEYIRLVKDALENIKSEHSDQWNVRNLINIQELITEYVKEEDDTSSSKKHLFTTVNIPSIEAFNSFKAHHRYPIIYFQTYLPSIFETVPPPNSLEGVLLRDISTDIIRSMDFNRKEVTRQLITLDLFFAKDCFTEPGISFDRLEKLKAKSVEEESDISTWKVEDVGLESVLQHIFNLPYQHHYPSYYYSILIEACIMAPQAIAPVFGRAIRFIYGNLQTIDVELLFRFLDWFSLHLSNFGFTWKWKEWEDDLNLNANHPKLVFIKQLIEKELRLSYPERLKDTLPEQFQSLLRSIPTEPVFKYYESDSNYEEQVRSLVNSLRSKKSEDIQKSIQDLKEKALSESVGEHAAELDRTLIDVLIATICYLGNRSLTHSKTWVSQTSDLLKEFIQTDDDKLIAVKSIVNYWVDLPHVGTWVMRHFIQTEVVNKWVVLEYLLQKGDDGLPPVVSSHGWEQLVYIIDGLKDDEEGVEYSVKIIKIVSDYLNEYEEKEDETSQWTAWWYNGILKSLFRKYPSLFNQARTKSEQGNKTVNDLFDGLKEIAEM